MDLNQLPDAAASRAGFRATTVNAPDSWGAIRQPLQTAETICPSARRPMVFGIGRDYEKPPGNCAVPLRKCSAAQRWLPTPGERWLHAPRPPCAGAITLREWPIGPAWCVSSVWPRQNGFRSGAWTVPVSSRIHDAAARIRYNSHRTQSFKNASQHLRWRGPDLHTTSTFADASGAHCVSDC